MRLVILGRWGFRRFSEAVSVGLRTPGADWLAAKFRAIPPCAKVDRAGPLRFSAAGCLRRLLGWRRPGAKGGWIREGEGE